MKIKEFSHLQIVTNCAKCCRSNSFENFQRGVLCIAYLLIQLKNCFHESGLSPIEQWLGFLHRFARDMNFPMLSW